MGRFETTVPFYAKYREPYPPRFFSAAATQLELNAEGRMIDIASGPGQLAIGFRPYVGSATVLEPEPAMLAAAKEGAERSGVALSFIPSRLEELGFDVGPFDFATIGRALHWLNRETALPVLGRMIVEGGQIAICGSKASDAPVNQWHAEFRSVRSRYSEDPHEKRYKIDYEQWFAGSRFRKSQSIEVRYEHRISIRHLIGRALSYSTTSPEVLGDRRTSYEADIAAALAPFAEDSHVIEEIVAMATVFR